MRHLTILVDMDDTIENLAEAWVDYLNARHQTSTSLSDITDWDISKAFPTLTKEQVYFPLNCPHSVIYFGLYPVFSVSLMAISGILCSRLV